MSKVLHGTAGGNQLSTSADKTQVYGLSGNDTIISDKKVDALLIGGSGDDSLIMLGGKGTLAGGDGADIFELNYSATEKISAVIEDLDPAEDKIVVNFDGKFTFPPLSTVNGDDVVWSNGGNFNLTVKSVRENDYFDGEASDEAWDVLKLTNDEREKENLSWLTMSDGLTKGAQIRAGEITGLADRGALSSHDRPDNKGGYSTIFDDVDKHYFHFGENLQAGAESAAEVMQDWIGSPSHYANIMNPDFLKLGVGYNHKDLSKNEYYWTQLFADSLKNPETISAENLSTVIPEMHTTRKFISLTRYDDTRNNDEYGATIDAKSGNDFITNSGLIASISGGKGKDTIDNSGAFVTINAGAGNDSIALHSTNNLIQYTIGDGSDTVSGLSSTDTLKISGYEYTPVTVGNDVIVSVGADSIKLVDAPETFTIDGTRSKLFLGTEGDDKLNNTVDGATIQALGGDDKITISGENVLFVHESGDDTVRGFNDTSTLKVLGKNYSSVTSGKNLILTDAGANNSITILDGTKLNVINIVDAKGKPLEIERTKNIVGTDNPDNLKNGSDDVTIQALGGDDTISNRGDGVSIDGGADNDSINNTGSDATITGGAGSDTIKNTGDNNSISGGADADTIEISGDENTINAEGGDDFISIKGARNVIEYVAGGGSDVIEGFNKTSTLRISGDVYTSTTSDKDVVVTVGDAEISLVGAADLDKINIVGTSQIETISSNYMDYNGHRYQLFDEGMTWEEAKAYCESLGGHLVVITDAAEQAAVEGLLKEKGTKNSYWLGGFKNSSSTSSKLITLTEGDDSHENTIKGATILALGGNDFIRNYGTSMIINGGDGNDTIYNRIEGTNASTNASSINGGDGDDYIQNWGASNVTISGGAGNDEIENTGDSVTIDAGAGDDYFSNYGSNVTINGGAGDDYFSNYGSNVTINGGAGNDSIYNGAYSVTIDLGDGDDTIYNYKAWHTTINGGAGNDSVYNEEGDYATINTGAGNDSVYNRSWYSTISTGAGDDSIYNGYDSKNASISGGEGNDSIEIYSGDEVSINGGAGDDLISLSSASNNLIQYAVGDGNDTIYGFYSTSTLSIGGASYSSMISGDDLILTVGDGSIRLVDAASLSLNIDGTLDSDSKLITLTVITLTEGDDTYYNTVGADATILALGGNDSITNNYANVSIEGGAGNDSISLDSSASNNVINYNSGDGNDSIYGFDDDDTLSISGAEYSTETSGDDVIVSVNDGENFISLVGAASLASVNITSGGSVSGVDITNSTSNTLITGTSGDDSIYNEGRHVTVDGAAGNDTINNQDDESTILGGEGDDSIYSDLRATIYGGAGNDTIKADAGYLDGGADDDIISLSWGIFLETSIIGGTGNDTIYDYITKGIDTGQRFKYELGDGNDVVYGFSDIDTLQIGDGTGSYSTLESGNDVIVTVGDGAITLKNVFATADTLNINSDSIELAEHKSYILTDENDYIQNIKDDVTIEGGTGNDTIYSEGDNSSLIGGAGDDSILNGDNNRGGGSSVTIDAGTGNDYIYSRDSISISGGAGNDTIYSEGGTVEGGSGNDYIDNSGLSSIIDAGEGNDSIRNWNDDFGNNSSITGGTGNDSVWNLGSDVTINGGAGDDTISLGSYASVNLIQYASGDGNDTIYGFRADSTLSISDSSYSTTTSGNDVIVTVGDGENFITLVGAASLASVNITSGDSVSGVDITNSTSNTLITGTSGDDTLRNYSGRNATIAALAGNDFVDNHGNSALVEGGDGNDTLYNYVSADTDDANYSTVRGGLGDDFIDNHGNHALIDGGAGNDTIDNYAGAWRDDEADYSTLLGGSGNDFIDNEGNYVSIDGGSDNDFISNTSSNVSIDGGAGNDSISNSGANVLFNYTSGDGNDTISGFNSTSTLSISGAAYSTTTSGDDVIVTVDDGKITLQGAANLDAINIEGTLNGGDSWQWVTGETWSYDNWGWNQPDGDGSALMIYNSTGNGWPQGSWNDLNPTGVNGQDFFSKENFGLICEWETIPSSKLIELTEGPDTYSESMESGTTLKALGGNDNINNWSGDSVTIDLGADDDYILNHSSYVLIEGADGSDTVASWIVDDDTLGTSSAYNTIRGGAGDDSIDNHGHHALIEGDSGNDTLYNYVGDDGGIHQGYEANYSTVRGGRGNDKIDNLGNHVLIEGGTGNDTIANRNGAWFDDEAEYSTLYGGAGKDSIFNQGDFVSIDGGAGDDTINNEGSNVTISSGAGEDEIYNRGERVSISGGADADTIDNHGSNDTILGGAGNDRISLASDSKNNLIQYTDGDGKDTIWGVTPDDTLNISDKGLIKGWTARKQGNDLLVVLHDAKGKLIEGSILLKGARNKSPKITLGESGSSGGTGGGMGGSGSGNGGNGGNGGSNSSGGTSGSSNSNSAASGGNSASGSSGISSATSSGGSGRGSRTIARQNSATVNQPVPTTRNQIIFNYQSGNKINSNEGHTGAFFDSTGNFYSGSTAGAIVIPDAMNKLIDLRDAAGNPFIKAYAASNAGVIDGRKLAGFEIIDGSAGADEIYAGRNGAQMSGGYGNDTMTGGRGVDIFVSGKAQGNDLIRNASLLDKVKLTDVTLNDISTTRENGKTISLTFRTGNVINVEYEDILSPKFIFADGSSYFYNRASQSWRVMSQASTAQNVYAGGEQTISSYQSGDKILFNAEYRGGGYDGEGNFSVNSSAGTLVVKNAADKVIDLTNSAGNSFVKAYAASKSGVIDGRELSGYQIINGSSGADVICAGNGGSQLWGGAEADVLVGGAGVDTFITGRTQGADLINNAATADNINLSDSTLSDIVATSESNGMISLSFNTGNVVNVQSSEALSARFTLADGSAYRYNHAIRSWQSA